MEKKIKEILKYIGENPDREGLKDTPKRFIKMLKELTEGYKQSPQKIINSAVFTIKYDEMVVVKNIEFVSLCEHHLLPFFGNCNVAYIPDGKIIGLSKIPRIVDMFSKRLQIQERMTEEIAEILQTTLKPKGVGVVVEAFHSCMMFRGVKKNQAKMITSAMLGAFKKDERTRLEFLNLQK